MADQFSSFKTFNDKETAADFSEVLKEHSIEFYIEEDVLEFDPSYANNDLDKDFHIMIRQSDFAKAKQAYETYFKSQLHKAPPDYYLFSFSNEELREIMAKPDEWGTFDYLLAEKILQDRNVAITETEKQSLKTERYNTLKQQETEKPSRLFLYYLLGIFFFPLGMMTGWAWGFSKKTLPDGKKVAVYDKETQVHGKIILALSFVMLAVFIYWKFIHQK